MVSSIGTIWRGRYGLRPPVADVALALALSIVAVLETISGQWSSPAVLLMTLPLAWRRRQPLAVFLAIAAAAVGVFQQAPYAGLTAVMIAAYSVGTYSRHRLLSLGVIIATATVIATVFHAGWPPLPDASAPYVIALSMWLVGNAIRSRQLRADAFADRATRLEREREQATREAVAAEHARIARELHDVVAHSVSVMVVQAGAARHILSKSPQQADEALRAVESSGREAMAELRHLLGLLNQDDDQVALAPQPGLDQLDSLVRRVGEAGLPVTLHVEGRTRPLPPGLDLAAYRVVQEALTNALKYAGLARTDVILDYREDELKIEVLDDGPGRSAAAGTGAGHGLVGMRERLALYGGTLEAGPRLERGYAVRAWLPLDGLGP
ncbi:MAG TPA: histidine kinase [Chloroflexota bacterium]|nr:histidine kinase [Chloroflexota bacterium]